MKKLLLLLSILTLFLISCGQSEKIADNLSNKTLTSISAKLKAGTSLYKRSTLAQSLPNIEVTGTYSDNSTNLLTITEAKIKGFNSVDLEENTLTITVDGKTTTLNVTFVEAPLKSIDFSLNNKTLIYKGDTPNNIFIKGEFTVTNDIGETLGAQPNIVCDTSSVGEKDLTVSFYGITKTIKVLVYTPAIDFTYSSNVITKYTGTDSNVVIPKYINGTEITILGNDVFATKTNLTKVIIPDGVTSIGSAAFYGCSNLSIYP